LTAFSSDIGGSANGLRTTQFWKTPSIVSVTYVAPAECKAWGERIK